MGQQKLLVGPLFVKKGENFKYLVRGVQAKHCHTDNISNIFI